MNCPFHAMFERSFRMCLLTMYDRGHELRVKLMGASREIPSMICKALEGIIGPTHFFNISLPNGILRRRPFGAKVGD